MNGTDVDSKFQGGSKGLATRRAEAILDAVKVTAVEMPLKLRTLQNFQALNAAAFVSGVNTLKMRIQV